MPSPRRRGRALLLLVRIALPLSESQRVIPTALALASGICGAREFDYMARKGPLTFVSVTAAAEPLVRALSRKVKSYIALRQDRAGMRRGPFWNEVRETKARDGTPKPGAHIVAPMRSAAGRDRLVEAINSSSVYGDTFARPAPAVETLKSYGLKELTPQAAYRRGIRRIKGSHPLPEGGDRVRASEALREALIRIGRIEPFTRSYAKTARREAWQFDAEGQGYLFASLPDTEAPGQHQREPVERPKIEPAPMLPLLSAVGNVDVLETMNGLGETHERNRAPPRTIEAADDEHPKRAIQALARGCAPRARISPGGLNRQAMGLS